jgi:Flp pilus assembly protein TadG
MRFFRDRSGAIAVEFAILSPLYLCLLLGMVAYAVYLGASHSVQQMTADAARYAVAGLDAAERQGLVTSYLAKNADGYAFVDRRKLSVSVEEMGASQYAVAISYDARDLPVWGLFQSLPMPSTTIAHRSVVRAGGM